MVRQQEDTERPVEIATDIRVEPVPFTFVLGEAHAVVSSDVPAKSVARRSAIVGSAAGEDLPHAGLTEEAVRRERAVVETQIGHCRVERPRSHHLVEPGAAVLDVGASIVADVSGRAATIAYSAVRNRERILHAPAVEHAYLEEVMV